MQSSVVLFRRFHLFLISFKKRCFLKTSFTLRCRLLKVSEVFQYLGIYRTYRARRGFLIRQYNERNGFESCNKERFS